MKTLAVRGWFRCGGCMDEAIRIAIGGGGTGGHVIPALEIWRAIRKLRPEVDFIYVGSANSLEEKLAKREGIPFYPVSVAALKRSLSMKNLATPFIAARGMFQSRALLRTQKVRLAIGTGGYSAWPVCAAARYMKLPYLLQEQNVWPGLVTRMLAPRAAKICLGYSEAANHLKSTPNRIKHTGNPIQVAGKSFDKENARRKLGLNPDRKTVFVTGGSGGALSINRAVEDIKDELLDRGFNLIWQTGKHWDKELNVPDRYRGRMMIERFLFRDQMGTAYQAADIAVARCGAITLAELANFALPALLVPFPHSAGGHQLANAKAVENAGGGRLIADSELTGEGLMNSIVECTDKEVQSIMSKAMSGLARPDAAEEIAREALALIPGTNG